MHKKRGILIVFLILLVIPLVFAGNYGAGTYGSGVFGIGETSEGGGPGQGGPSGGGGTGSTITGKTTYECSDDSDCKTEEGEVCWNSRCIKLFDIKIIQFDSPVKLGEFFEFTYLIKGVAEINGDVEINFWLEKDEKVVTTGSDTIYIGSFEEKTETTKLFLPSKITSGTYDFSIQLNFGSYTAKAHRTVEIIVDEEKGIATIIPIPEPEVKEAKVYIISALIGLTVFIISLLFYLERKRIKAGIIKEEKWIKKHIVSVLVFLLFVILGTLTYYLGFLDSIKRFFIENFSYVVGLIVFIIILFISKRIHLIERFSLWKKERTSIRKKPVKKKQKRKSIEKKLKRKHPRSKEFLSNKHIKLLLIFLAIAILSGVLVYLFYSEFFMLEQLQGLWKNITGLSRSIVWIIILLIIIIYLVYINSTRKYRRQNTVRDLITQRKKIDAILKIATKNGWNLREIKLYYLAFKGQDYLKKGYSYQRIENIFLKEGFAREIVYLVLSKITKKK